MGKSDAYARVLLSGIEKGKTITFKNNLSPDWDEVIYIPVHSTRERLLLEVMDQENIGKDRSLGLIEIAAAEYTYTAENSEYEIHDLKKPMSEILRIHRKGTPRGKLNFTIAFYPTLNLVDPEDEAEEKAALSKVEERSSVNGRKPSLDRASRKSLDSNRDSLENGISPGKADNREAGKINTSLTR